MVLHEGGDVDQRIAQTQDVLLRKGCRINEEYNQSSKLLNNNEHADKKLIGVDGKWYDVTAFIKHHPGGNIIEHFIGKDATEVFHGFHEKDVLKYRKPVSTYTRSQTDRASKAFSELHQYFIKNGFFETSYRWYTLKIAVAFSILATSFALVIWGEQWYIRYLGAVFLGGFWHQCGFFMHDTMHHQFTHNRVIDQWLGTFFGTVCFGVCGSWWREDHFLHHALTNTIDSENGNVCDPQCKEEIWAQNERLFFYFTKLWQYYSIKLQHFLFIPVNIFIGRFAILIDSFKDERRVHEIVAWAIHWAYVFFLLSFLPSWKDQFLFYYLAAVSEGILHIQLLTSHYSKPFYDKKEINNDINWYRMQIECNINLTGPVWMDWFHGGLNFHIEHHLYPTMPRHNYRRASEHVKRVCKEVGVVYDECSFSEAVWRTLKHLKNTSVRFKLDPR